MKLVIALALIFAVVGFINGQTMPQRAVQSCAVPAAGTIANAFCREVLTYPLPGGVFDSAKDTQAHTNYNTTIALVSAAAQASATCQAALKAYYCQYNFARCLPYSNYSSIAVARCNAVETACSVTAFPGTFVGTPCINNTLLSIDNAAVCIAGAPGTLGGQCVTGTSFFNPTFIPPDRKSVV